MTQLLNVVLPTFLIIFIGFIFGKLKKPDMSVISEIVIWIGLPALVLTSMLEKQIVLSNAAKVWGSALLIMIGCGVIAWVIFKIFRQKHSGSRTFPGPAADSRARLPASCCGPPRVSRRGG